MNRWSVWPRTALRRLGRFVAVVLLDPRDAPIPQLVVRDAPSATDRGSLRRGTVHYPPPVVEPPVPTEEKGLGDPPKQSPLYHARERPRYTRQELIRGIQRETESKLICYVAGPGASITASDIPPVVDLLQDIKKGTNIDLLLHTGGGDIDQAERASSSLCVREDLRRGTCLAHSLIADGRFDRSGRNR